MSRLGYLGIAASFAGFVLATTTAGAAPLPVSPNDAVSGSKSVEQVAYGCPYGFKPNAYGYCRRVFFRPRYYGGYGYRPYRPYGYGPRPGFGISIY